eukprot:TRINITY_DN1032_c0_g1_i1.p1 TRINITY_DN1032_c0_g1~~TRINITY_DN1032_c0_g1_i1.p1  ORF type:complete len:314 (-),score=72.77 TRINITY_DN1032_c0_g1_i1:614-1555(-)
MGQLISYLSSPKESPDFFIDLENATPSSPEDKQVYDEVAEILRAAPNYLELISNYKGCGELIRQAMSSPTKETEDAAWAAVVPCVEVQKQFYEYGTRIDDVVKLLFRGMSRSSSEQVLQDQQSLAKLLAQLFDFVLRFDEKKMSCPQIQNDFSYYRRTTSKIKGPRDESSGRMKDELANKISLFFASPTPMMRVVVDSTKKYLLDNPSTRVETLTQILALLANIFEGMVNRRKIEKPEMIEFVLRAMTGCLVLYDHVNPLGAFHKKSPIHVKRCIELLKKQPVPQDGLLNAIRYTTLHLNDKDTPSSVTALLA